MRMTMRMNIFTITPNLLFAMAYDLEEQEQLASLKAWWSQYGNPVTWALILGLGGYAAWSGWNLYQRNHTIQAAQLYDEVQKAISAKDNSKVQRAATDIESKYSRTPYAQMAALAAAKNSFEINDIKSATLQLQWAANNGYDEEYQAIAKIRLAAIYLDEKAYDEGLKILSGTFPPGFHAVVADRKGDILAAQNKVEDARGAYQAALEHMDQKNPGRQLIELKLDAIGGTSA
jgi:predicted negative regulator of RcsB-dependent stress response